MKKIFLKFPVVSRFTLAILLGVIALIASGWIQQLISAGPWFPFTGVICLVMATWLMYKTDNKSLRAIGLDITLNHLLFLVLGLAIGITAEGIVNYLGTFYTGGRWHLNPAISQPGLWKSLYFILPSVIIQELMFRGYLFTKTIEISNVITANIIFAILFTMVHVLDRDVLQHPIQALSLALIIPVGHLYFATGLLRSKTLYFPIGLHWGNNWAVNCLTGYGKNDHTIFYIANQSITNSWLSFIVLLFIFNGVFLLVTLLIWRTGRKARAVSVNRLKN